MEGDSSTEALRTLAPKWSLAGDDQLLSILQNTHQRIITKCQEVNSKLSEMSSALDDAGISLQNVNNKFMALSNSQFIESRVYDDDEVANEDNTAKTVPPPKVENELSMLKRSIDVLESMHESVIILRDSDTESDSEDDEISRRVLKPKDIYADRPLPHIIGSQAWRNKWHAGLLPEDSDSDSTTSKHEAKESDQYSESDQEMESTAQTDTLRVPDRTVSETSSELASEQDILPPPAPKQTPSDIAAELARRLGGQPPKVTEPEVEPQIQTEKPSVKKVYRPEQPVTGRVFLDEPPPIDDYLSESSSDNGDIFAELHKQKPNENKRIDINPAEDLFGFNNEDYESGDIFKDFAKDKVTNQTAQKSSLFDKAPEPDLFVEKKEDKQSNIGKREEIEDRVSEIKKPVGGISVFGNNKGAESIGAAILRRQRKSSSSSEANSDVVDEVDRASKNDIFDDLFDKSKKTQKEFGDNKTKVDEKVHKSVIDEIFERNKHKGAVKKGETPKKPNVLDNIFDKSSKNVIKPQVIDKVDSKTPEKPKIDLFNDDLFDNIDDIFADNVIKISKKDDKNHKSLFDDDDSLFANVAAPSKEIVKTSLKEDKNIFESDDDLFADKPKVSVSKKTVVIQDDTVVAKDTKEIGSIASHSKNADRSIFDSDDDLFSGKPNAVKNVTGVVNLNTSKQLKNEPKVSSTGPDPVSKSIFDSDEELFSKNNNISIETKNAQVMDKEIADSQEINKDIFSSDDELFKSKSSSFKNSKSNNNIDSARVTVPKETLASSSNVLDEIKNQKSKAADIKKSIFDSDSDSDIFSGLKTNIKSNEPILNAESNHTPVLREPKEKLFDQNLKSQPENKNPSALKSPSLFDDEDDDLFMPKENLTEVSDVINKAADAKTDTKNETEQSYNERVTLDLQNNIQDTNEETQKNLNVKIDNNNKQDTLLKINFLNNQDNSSANDITPEVPSENNTNKNIDFKKDNNLLQSQNTKPTSNIEDKETDGSVNQNIFGNNLRDLDIMNAKSIEYNISNIEDEESGKPCEEQQKINTNVKNNLDIMADEIKEDSRNSNNELNIATSKDVKSIQYDSQMEKDNFNSDIFNDVPHLDETVDSVVKEATQKQDIFSDIFSEPPIFEKPKEPKKSKNVNALFDDDSDDEALFFKKSDVVDDVPNDFSPDVKNENLFGIFHDEPPAIEVDFTTKTKEPSVKSKSEDVRNTLNSKIEAVNNDHISKLDIGDNEISVVSVNKNSNLNQFTEDSTSEIHSDETNKTVDNKSISIHDLFNKDDAAESNSNNQSKSVEHTGETSKSAIEATVNKKDILNSLFNDQSDDDIFKPANVIKKKAIIIQEDEIDNLYISKNKNPTVDANKNFDDIFKTTEKEILIKETKISNDSLNDNYNKTTMQEEVSKPILIKESKIIHSQTENKKPESISKVKDFVQKSDDSKSNSETESIGTNKIGKLKAKINIDVSRLLPGASPRKKVDKPKSPDQEDIRPVAIVPTPFANKNRSLNEKDKETNEPKAISVTNTNKHSLTPPNNNDDNAENSEQRTTKTITFDEQEAKILDNTLSKERAKIQVKRRPSTRRARREAVRKSTIDNDSTDNSSSIDDQPKSLDADVSNIDKDASTDKESVDEQPKSLDFDVTNIEKDISTDKENINEEAKSLNADVSTINKNELTEKEDNKSNKYNEQDIAPVIETVPKTNVQSKEDNTSLFINKNVETIKTDSEPQSRKLDTPNRTVTSKVVYVLNDEDIFNTKPDVKVIEKNIADTKTPAKITPINTLGTAHKDKSKAESVPKNNAKSKPSLFDETSDDDKLFGKGKNRKTFSTVLFDSDSDDDLFVGSKERKETKDFRKTVPIVKGSLFGDDDDDDLFGDKKKKPEKMQPSRPGTSRDSTKSTKAVFEDPLSMLGNDD